MRYAVGRWAEDRWQRVGREFSVTGRGLTSTAAANECACNLWNPHSVRSLWVIEFMFSRDSNPSAIDVLRLCRTTTQGTAGSTVTPDLDNDFEREVTPNTGASLGLSNFSVEPTLQTPELYSLAFELTGEHQFMNWVFPDQGIRVGPGTGLGLFSTGAIAISPSTVSFRFRE